MLIRPEGVASDSTDGVRGIIPGSVNAASNSNAAEANIKYAWNKHKGILQLLLRGYKCIKII